MAARSSSPSSVVIETRPSNGCACLATGDAYRMPPGGVAGQRDAIGPRPVAREPGSNCCSAWTFDDAAPLRQIRTVPARFSPAGNRCTEERYPDYLAAAKPAFDKFGARFIVRGGAFESMEGKARDRNVVVEFADRATATACYHSAEYGSAKAIRQKYAEADFIIIDGA